MKIAVLAHAHYAIKQPYSGGLEAHTDLLVNELVALGHDVTLYAKRGSISEAKIVPFFTGDAQEGKNRLLNLGYRYACSHIQLHNYDLIINNSYNSYPLAWHKADMPHMLTIFHTPPLPKMQRRLHVTPYQDNRSYIAVSELTASQWQNYCNQQVQVVANGLPLERWRAYTDTPVRESAIWTGRITAEKGTHVAIQAALLADIPLTICGNVYDKKYFKKQVEPFIDGVKIKYVGHLSQSEINKLYGESSVALVTPLWDEPFGFVSVEALASGTPVAALANGSVPTIVTNAVGALAASDSAEDLAAAIKQATTRDRRVCANYAHSSFDIEVMVNNYLSAIPQMSYADETLQWQI